MIATRSLFRPTQPTRRMLPRIPHRDRRIAFDHYNMAGKVPLFDGLGHPMFDGSGHPLFTDPTTGLCNPCCKAPATGTGTGPAERLCCSPGTFPTSLIVTFSGIANGPACVSCVSLNTSFTCISPQGFSSGDVYLCGRTNGGVSTACGPGGTFVNCAIIFNNSSTPFTYSPLGSSTCAVIIPSGFTLKVVTLETVSGAPAYGTLGVFGKLVRGLNPCSSFADTYPFLTQCAQLTFPLTCNFTGASAIAA